MSGAPPKSGDRVLVITKAQNRYEGYFNRVDRASATFILHNVRCFGTENRPVEEFSPASDVLYSEVIFKATDTDEFIILDDHVKGELNDPAVVSASPGGGNRMREHNNFQYQRNNAYPPRYFNRGDMRGRPGNRQFNNPNHNQHPNVSHKDYDMRSQRFYHSRYFPGDGTVTRHVGNAEDKPPLPDFDFQKGLDEFSRLKLNDSKENAEEAGDKGEDGEKEKSDETPHQQGEEEQAYDKDKSFFDRLAVGIEFMDRRVLPRIEGMQPRRNTNLETFGMDVVNQMAHHRPRGGGGGMRGGRGGRGGIGGGGGGFDRYQPRGGYQPFRRPSMERHRDTEYFPRTNFSSY